LPRLLLRARRLSRRERRDGTDPVSAKLLAGWRLSGETLVLLDEQLLYVVARTAR